MEADYGNLRAVFLDFARHTLVESVFYIKTILNYPDK